ncbi:hypothetical protein TNCV_810481 [Trichonephila clavipes]|uniref:Uncharacterized protein n=1 Tax=Trichonephila clavipes TaxID=2585209 RepID=A0A8X6VJU1_TRICX|nr:hypothetical protein TNCV_810481 [Trichonephila clavipes]
MNWLECLGVKEAFSFGRPDCKNSPQSHIVRVYDAGLGKSGVYHSAEWHVGDWLSDGIREAWLRFFIWVRLKSRGPSKAEPCRNRVFKGKGLVNSNSEGTVIEIGVNKVNQRGWNFIGYKLESESINPNAVKGYLDVQKNCSRAFLFLETFRDIFG